MKTSITPHTIAKINSELPISLHTALTIVLIAFIMDIPITILYIISGVVATIIASRIKFIVHIAISNILPTFFMTIPITSLV